MLDKEIQKMVSEGLAPYQAPMLKSVETAGESIKKKQKKNWVPNVVMAFSNSPPDVRELAKERVRMFYISNKQLKRKTMLR